MVGQQFQDWTVVYAARVLSAGIVLDVVNDCRHINDKPSCHGLSSHRIVRIRHL